MGILLSLYPIILCYKNEKCLLLEKCLNITGLISNLIIICLLITEILKNNWNKMNNIGIIIYFIYFSLTIITLIIHIILMAFEKYLSFKIK